MEKKKENVSHWAFAKLYYEHLMFEDDEENRKHNEAYLPVKLCVSHPWAE